jgi:hypothetical protein
MQSPPVPLVRDEPFEQQEHRKRCQTANRERSAAATGETERRNRRGVKNARAAREVFVG